MSDLRLRLLQDLPEVWYSSDTASNLADVASARAPANVGELTVLLASWCLPPGQPTCLRARFAATPTTAACSPRSSSTRLCLRRPRPSSAGTSGCSSPPSLGAPLPPGTRRAPSCRGPLATVRSAAALTTNEPLASRLGHISGHNARDHGHWMCECGDHGGRACEWGDHGGLGRERRPLGARRAAVTCAQVRFRNKK